MKKVCHLTDAHGPEDDRIFLKECRSLAKEGYDVYIVAFGETYDKEGIHIVGIDGGEGRFNRIINGSRQVYKKALEIDADLYHFHDPELLPYGLKLKRRGKKVIFDSHEDVPSQILDKQWIPKVFRSLVAKIYKSYETYVVKRIDAVVAATPYIKERFWGRARLVEDIKNYPRLDDIIFHEKSFQEKESIICYAGAISEQRGEKVMLKAMETIEGQLLLAGHRTTNQAVNINGEVCRNNKNIVYLGVLDRKGINDLYKQSVIGLCLLYPTASYINALPIKIFEYMAAGIPFICSDFLILRRLVDETGAGYCVSPFDIEELRAKIKELLANRDLAQDMGRKGRKAIVNKYSWEIEEKRLFGLYRSILH